MSVGLVRSQTPAWISSRGSGLTEPSQTLHTHVYMGPCELCISKTFPTCLLHVTLSLFGDFGGEKMPPILTCSLLKMKGGGGLPSPWQRSSTVSPSLTKPWGDSFHSSTIVGGSRHTQNQIKQAYSAKVALHFHNADRTVRVWLHQPQHRFKH